MACVLIEANEGKAFVIAAESAFPRLLGSECKAHVSLFPLFYPRPSTKPSSVNI